MDRQLSIGQNVYIIPITNPRDFKALDRAITKLGEDGTLPLTGRVTKMWKSDDLSHHGSPYYETYYAAVGVDGSAYTTQQLPGACYMHGVAELVPIDSFMRSVESKLKANKVKITKLNKHNEIYETVLNKARMIGVV